MGDSMRAHSERGVALIVALFVMLAVSVVGASLMFLSQTETYATMNYRMMSQARYAGEAAIQKAAEFLLDGSYTIPSPGGTDDLANYTLDHGSPVLYSGSPVVLSADADYASNYPVASVQSAFDSAAHGTLAAGNTTIEYSAYAKLLGMQQFDAYGGTDGVVQTWEITGIGRLSGSREASVEVVALLEQPKVAANTYAAFATADICGAMYFHGNVTINSYDSSQGPPSTTTQASGGDVGTNGNLEIQGSVDVQGNLYSPRTGVGTCEDGAVVALSETGHATVEGGSPIQLPTEVEFPPPVFSTTPPTNTVTINAALLSNPATACSSLGLTLGTNCSISGTTVTVDGGGSDVTMPSVVIGSGYTLKIAGHSPAQNVNINSLTGSGNFQVDANLLGAGNESVVLKVAGLNPDSTEMTTALDLDTISWKQNSTVNQAKYDASALQIVYGGHGTLNMNGGNAQSAATIYAPNADFQLKGTQDFYGSILAHTITNGGNASIHYDRSLSGEFFVAGQSMLGTFSWKRY
jgi:Tfp pilus assembly protein PilX